MPRDADLSAKSDFITAAPEACDYRPIGLLVQSYVSELIIYNGGGGRLPLRNLF